MTRPIPDICEVQGEVGKFGDSTPCDQKVTAAVSVEGLNPLYVCDHHLKGMLEFWGSYYEATWSKV